jgi:A/G-specific adenine glycosylase
VQALAQADEDTVLQHWAGLGYYARARNLHYAAKQVMNMGGEFPQTLEGLMELKGVGRSTAGAILALGWQQRGVIMDGNVKRVLSRHFAIAGDSSSAAVQQQLWALAEQLTPTYASCSIYPSNDGFRRNLMYAQQTLMFILSCSKNVSGLCLGTPNAFPQKKAS